MSPFSIGERIAERYYVEDVKRGQACLTYFCHDEPLGRPVVLKSPRYDPMNGSEDLAGTFVRGAARWILAGRELGIAEAYNLLTVASNDRQDVPYLVLEFVEGDPRAGASLEGWIQDIRLDLRLALYFAHAVCSAMMKLQKKLGKPGADFVHVNLKPQNILVTHEGTIKITDIGLSEMAYREAVRGSLSAPSSIHQNEVKEGQLRSPILGAPLYMSPEQLLALPTIDKRSDIYSFGCILYEMCTRRHVFDASSDGEFISKHIEQIPNSPKKSNPAISLSLEGLILSCLSKNPAERPSDFGEIRETIQEIIRSAGMPSGIRFWLFGFSDFAGTPRVKSDMRGTREDEIIILAKACGVQYVIDQCLVKDREELELIQAQKAKAKTAEERAESQRKKRVEDLVLIGDAFLQMAERSEGKEREKSARSAISKYVSAHNLVPHNSQIGFRLAMACRTLAGLIREVNEGLSEELMNLAIKRYDRILQWQKEPDLAIIGDSYYLLPFHAMFQRGTIHAARGQFHEAVRDMERLSNWIKHVDRTDFKPFYEHLDKEISAALDLLKEDAA